MKKNADFSARVSQIIEYLNITPAKFSKELGYGRAQGVYDILSGKARPSTDFYERFLRWDKRRVFSLEWIITGEGEMIKPAHTGVVAEDAIPYLKRGAPPLPCNDCRQKEDKIKLLAEQLSLLKEHAEFLRTVADDYKEEIERYRQHFDDLRAPSNDNDNKGQKRKAG